MKELKLRNGSVEPEGLVVAAWTSIRTLLEERPISLMELAELADNPNYRLFGETGRDLLGVGLVQEDPFAPSGYRMHGSMRNIVLSAIEGRGLSATVVNPIAEEGVNHAG